MNLLPASLDVEKLFVAIDRILHPPNRCRPIQKKYKATDAVKYCISKYSFTVSTFLRNIIFESYDVYKCGQFQCRHQPFEKYAIAVVLLLLRQVIVDAGIVGAALQVLTFNQGFNSFFDDPRFWVKE